MEMVFFALLTIYLSYRLWSVLGTRTGYEKQTQFFQFFDKGNKKTSLKSVQIVQNGSDLSLELRKKLDAIQKKDSSFDIFVFFKKAKIAFMAIMKAYASANHKILKALLSQSVYESFAKAVEERDAHNLRQETEIDNLEIEISDINIKSDKIQMIVKFTSSQMIATFNERGESFDNPSRIKIPSIDIWTFEKSITSKQTTWLLVNTKKVNSDYN
ncbi:MAG: Tim44/TimA family putative adaptor protein [Alphaproteobacteria bacterium]